MSKKPESTTAAEVIKVVSSRSADQRISDLLKGQQEDFPAPSDIQLDEPYREAFTPPRWCDVERFEYGWTSPLDTVQMDKAINDHWKIVNMTNHPNGNPRDFMIHGAVERRGMVLMYRPLPLGERMRQIPVLKQQRAMGTLLEKRGDADSENWEAQLQVGRGARSDGFQAAFHEKAGSPGDMAPGDHPGQRDE